MDTARACRLRGIRPVAVTAGYINPEPAAEFFSAMDAINVNLKAFTEDFYRRLTGASLAPVLETLRYIRHETDAWLELTTLIIPGANDTPEEWRAMADWVRTELGPEVPVHFTAFHPDYKLRDRSPTPPETLARARRIARAQGLHHVYTGNVRDPKGASTFCQGCGARLIERDGYRLTAWHLTPAGRCPTCATPGPGVFEANPGGRRGPLPACAPRTPLSDTRLRRRATSRDPPRRCPARSLSPRSVLQSTSSSQECAARNPYGIGPLRTRDSAVDAWLVFNQRLL